MKAKLPPTLIITVLLAMAGAFLPAGLRGHAKPRSQAGPTSQPSDAPELGGAWVLNRTKSDDPEQKMQGREEDISPAETAASVPNGNPNTNSTSSRHSGSRTTSRPAPPVAGAAAIDTDREKTLEFLRASDSLTLEQKQNELDLTDAQSRKRIFFTDGRKLKKSNDEKYQEIAAQWQGSRLVSDEKGPRNAKLSRTFQLSPDGRQLYDIVQLDDSKVYSPLVIRYVYDRAPQP